MALAHEVRLARPQAAWVVTVGRLRISAIDCEVLDDEQALREGQRQHRAELSPINAVLVDPRGGPHDEVRRRVDLELAKRRRVRLV